MPIRWKTLPIFRTLAEIEQLIGNIEPWLQVAKDMVESVRSEQIDTLPGYQLQYLAGLQYGLNLEAAKGQLRMSRDALPADALAREREGEQHSLHLGVKKIRKSKPSEYVAYREREFQARVAALKGGRREPVLVGTQGTLGNNGEGLRVAAEVTGSPGGLVRDDGDGIKTVACADCGREFVFVVGDPQYGEVLEAIQRGEGWFCDDCFEE